MASAYPGMWAWNARTNNLSRDQQRWLQEKTRGSWYLTQNDPDLVREFKGSGIKVIYRQTGDGDEDGVLGPGNQTEAQIKARAEAFVNERAQKGADRVYLTNEVKPSPLMLKFTDYALKRCVALGIKGVPFNLGTHAPYTDWLMCETLALYAVDHDMEIGFHIYLDGIHDDTAFFWQKFRARLQALRPNLPIKFFATEVGYIMDYQNAGVGFRGVPDGENKAKNVMNTLSPVFFSERIVPFWFSADDWPVSTASSGFGSWNVEAITDLMQDLNVMYPYKEVTVAVKPTPSPAPSPAPSFPSGTDPYQGAVRQSSGIKLRPYPGTNNKEIRTLPYGEIVTVFKDPVVESDGYKWLRVKTARNEEGWCAENVGGVETFKVVDPTNPNPSPFQIFPPFRNYQITSRFNDPRDYSVIAPTKKQSHEGIDFIDLASVQCKTEPVILAAQAGQVAEVSYDVKGYGNYVVINHGNGFRTLYAHMAVDGVFVKVGQKVGVHQILGLMGATGNATGPHCHFNLIHDGQGLSGYVYPSVVDPAPYLVSGW